jgi:hypothetical protein
MYFHSHNNERFSIPLYIRISTIDDLERNSRDGGITGCNSYAHGHGTARNYLIRSRLRITSPLRPFNRSVTFIYFLLRTLLYWYFLASTSTERTAICLVFVPSRTSPGNRQLICILEDMDCDLILPVFYLSSQHIYVQTHVAVDFFFSRSSHS